MFFYHCIVLYIVQHHNTISSFLAARVAAILAHKNTVIMVGRAIHFAFRFTPIRGYIYRERENKIWIYQKIYQLLLNCEFHTRRASAPVISNRSAISSWGRYHHDHGHQQENLNKANDLQQITSMLTNRKEKGETIDYHKKRFSAALHFTHVPC